MSRDTKWIDTNGFASALHDVRHHAIAERHRPENAVWRQPAEYRSGHYAGGGEPFRCITFRRSRDAS